MPATAPGCPVVVRVSFRADHHPESAAPSNGGGGTLWNADEAEGECRVPGAGLPRGRRQSAVHHAEGWAKTGGLSGVLAGVLPHGICVVCIPLPPKFEKTDFVRPDFFSIRGKLNVPRERFWLFAERAWVASLFLIGKDTDLAGLWLRHRSRLAELVHATIPGAIAGPVQLLMPGILGGLPAELASLDEAKLALVVDDLVASGDVQVRGRGKKKRFQLVERGAAS
jgi:hypothetical protein